MCSVPARHSIKLSFRREAFGSTLCVFAQEHHNQHVIRWQVSIFTCIWLIVLYCCLLFYFCNLFLPYFCVPSDVSLSFWTWKYYSRLRKVEGWLEIPLPIKKVRFLLYRCRKVMTAIDNLCIHILLFFKGSMSSPEEPSSNSTCKPTLPPSAAQPATSSLNSSKHISVVLKNNSHEISYYNNN